MSEQQEKPESRILKLVTPILLQPSDATSQSSVFGPAGHLGPGDINQAAHDINIFHSTAPGVSIPRQLPRDISLFTGRETELAQLGALLALAEDSRSPVTPIMAIVGTAGVGKTALAVRWASKVRDHFPDGDLYCDMRGYHSKLRVTPESALGGFLRDLDPGQALPSGLEALASLYRSRVSGRRILILLDNVADAETVRSLLPGSPSCFVLITSRSNLSGLAVRDGISLVPLAPLPANDANILLRKIIGAGRADNEAEAITELARLSVYLPLTLRIAAGRAASQPQKSLSQMAEELTKERRLDLFSTPDHDESTAIRSVFSWSLNNLSPAERRMFRLLGLHAGTDISVSAAAALAGTTVHEAEHLLEALREVHLMKEEAGRYQFHDLLAIYASERVRTDESVEDRTEALRRVLHWYLHSSHAAERILSKRTQRVTLNQFDFSTPPLTFSTQDKALEWCEAERVNLVSSTSQAAAAGEYEIAWKLPNTLWGFLQLRRYWTDWIFTHKIALTAARELQDPEGEAWTLGSLAMACRDLRRFEEAISYLEQAIAICQRTGWQWGEGIALTILGAVYYDLGKLENMRRSRFEKAIEVLTQAEIILHSIEDKWGEGFALNNLGGIYRYLGDFGNALDCLRRALAARRAVNDDNGEADTLNELGNVNGAMGNFDEAFSCLEDSLNIRRAIGNRRGEAYAFLSIGIVQSRMGRLEEARQSLQEALALFEKFGDDPQVGEVRSLLAHLERA